jgi:hypothetical protein
MTVSDSVRKRVRQQAKYRCGYCRVEEQHVYAPMEVEHIIPIALGGTDDEENLWLACPWCNVYKLTKTHGFDHISQETVSLFNPRQQNWLEHFEWDSDQATILGITPCGRATVNALRFNESHTLDLRRRFVRVGWYPPEDER